MTKEFTAVDGILMLVITHILVIMIVILTALWILWKASVRAQ
jgi:heme/copper-type cytochrome/quinol oxidase subunit 4